MLSEGTYGVLSQEAGVGPRWGRQLGQDYGDKKIPRAPCSRKLWPLGVVVTPGWLWGCLPGRAGRQLGFSVGRFSGQRPAKGPAASGSSGHNSQVVGEGGSGRREERGELELYHSFLPSGRLEVILRQHLWLLGGWVSCWYRGSGHLAPSVLKKWSAVATVINRYLPHERHLWRGPHVGG